MIQLHTKISFSNIGEAMVKSWLMRDWSCKLCT